MGAVSGTGYQHTLSDLRAHVYACLMQDESTSHFKKARVEKWINQVFDKMRLKGLYSISADVFTTSADQQTWTPPSTVWRLVGITYDLDGDEVALEDSVQVDLFDMTGKLVGSSVINAFETNSIMDVSKLANANYLLSIHTNDYNHYATYKIQKTR